MKVIVPQIFITCVASSERDWGIADDGLAEAEGFADPVLSSGFKPGKQSGICILKNMLFI
jgi:hypothetical protein